MHFGRLVFHRRIHPAQKRDFKSYQLRYASKTHGQYKITVKLLGSFRLTAGNRHLHRYCIFTEQVSETVLQSLHFSTRGNLPRKELRYLRIVLVYGSCVKLNYYYLSIMCVLTSCRHEDRTISSFQIVGSFQNDLKSSCV